MTTRGMCAHLTVNERRIFRRLSTPARIQNFLEELTINFADTNRSPRCVLREKRAHCFEGALFAAAALWYHGERPLILDLRSTRDDDDHVVALFRRRGCWGAISKTNHAVLRYREPIYRTIHELVLSYFHEYFLDDGRKTLRSYSRPFDLLKRGDTWVTTEQNLRPLADALDDSPHFDLFSRRIISGFRRADAIEIRVGKIVEWPR
ncbi:MAG: hypothetical protein V1723_04560 [Candidatus Uhrbacteria bacterium]